MFTFLKQLHVLVKRLSFILLMLIIAGNVHAQNEKKKLQNQYNQLLQEISSIEKNIKNTYAKRTKSLSEIKNLNAKIEAREGLISNINHQAVQLDKDISETAEIIGSLEKDIADLKKEYAEMVYYAYKNHSNINPLLFVLSAKSFNEGVNRINYMRKYTSYRKNQSHIIESTIEALSKKNDELKERKEEKLMLIAMQKDQKNLLVKEKGMINTLVVQLKGEESLLKKSAKKKNQDAEALNQRIKKIIEEEIRLARERAAKENIGKSGGLSMTPAEKALSRNFIENKNKLPWPVTRGHVVDKFGKQPHPTVPSVYIDNNGVGIQTTKDAEVRAIFSGKVVSVFYLPTEQNSVIIKHGEYFSVYSNLTEVYVKPNDAVNTKQLIGKAHTDATDNSTTVDLQIWQGIVKLNPELWLARH